MVGTCDPFNISVQEAEAGGQCSDRCGRHRVYVESPTLEPVSANYSWSEPKPWLAADAGDPSWMGSTDYPRELVSDLPCDIRREGG